MKFLIKSVVVLALAALIFGGGGYLTYNLLHPYRDLRFPPLTPRTAWVPPLERQINKARVLRKEGKLADAQKLLREQLRIYRNSPTAKEGRELLGNINTEMFFSTAYPFGKTEYVVRRGDTLWRIARKLDSSPEAIIRTNNLASDRLHIGDRLFVPEGDFTLTLDLPNERAVVHQGDHFFKQYPIVAMELPRSRQPQIATHVIANTFWREGQRLTSAEEKKNAEGVTPWIQLAQSGYVLYGVSETENDVEDSSVEITEKKSPETSNPDIPPHGIALMKDDLAELQLLIDRGTPVTIIRPAK